MMTAANRETAVLAVQTVKEVSNMGNRPVNRRRRNTGEAQGEEDIPVEGADPVPLEGAEGTGA